jgi:oxygen-independent coproporphyrinogen-3 oxidase
MMKPYEIYPNRIIAHLEIDEHMRQISYPSEEIQERTMEILKQNGTGFGHRVGYFHIPFYEKFCTFCVFYRVRKDDVQLARFLDALIENLRWFSEHPYVSTVPFEAIYLGGGTPTTITPSQMHRLTSTIKECLPLSPNVEFTSESTFANITDEMLQALREGGVNRMSLGVQTFSPRLRKLIGRECTPDDVIEKIGKVRRIMDVVNLDLIYNFPTQTLKEWEEDLKIATETEVDGISVHPLIPAEDSPLTKMIQQGVIEPMGDTRKQYDFHFIAHHVLPERGYHPINLAHFTNGPKERILYLRLRLEEGDCFPFGAGGVGNFYDLVILNHKNVEHYINSIKDKQFPAEVAAPLPDPIKFLWALLGQLQQMKVEKEHFRKNYTIDLDEKYGELIADMESKGLIENYPEHFILTPLGLFWVFNICSEFFRHY